MPWWRNVRLWAALFLAAVVVGNSGFRRLVSRAWELHKLRRELASLEREQSSLAGRISTARVPGPALERAARKELGYLKSGEIEYRFPPPSKDKR